MPIPIIIYVALVGLGVGATAAIALWTKMLNWADSSLFPWVKDHLPQLSGIVRTAFALIDKAAVATARAVRNAWNQLRGSLLKMFIEIEGSYGTNRFTRTIVSWMQVAPQQVVKVETTASNIPWEELPDEVREQMLRRGEKYELDFTEKREEELEHIA
jgi:hypothetical protein